MYRAIPIHQRSVFDIRLNGIQPFGQTNLGLNEINVGKQAEGVDDVRYGRAHHVTELGEDANDFTPFLVFQFADIVISLNNLGRFNIHSSPRSRLIMDDARHTTFQSRSHRYHQTTVTHRGCNVLFDKPVTLSCL